MALLVAAHGATDINQGAIPAILPFFIAEYHITYAMAAMLVFTVNLVSTVFQPLFGHMTDRRSRPWLIPASMLITGCGVAFAGVSPNLAVGFAGLVLCGLGVALFHPEGARLMHHLAGSKKATAMSLFAVGGQLGFALGPVIATALLLWSGIKGTAYLLVLTGAVAAYVIFMLPRFSEGYDTGHASKAVAEPRAGEDAWLPFIYLSAALLVRSSIFYGLNTFLPLYWVDALHQSRAVGGTSLGILLSSAMLGNVLGGRTADSLGYKKVIVAGMATLAVSLPLFVLTRNSLIASALLIPIGFTLAVPFGPMVALGQTYLPSRVGLASGITMGLAFSFGGLTTPILGSIADRYGLSAGIAVVAALPAVCTILVSLLPATKAGNSMVDKENSPSPV